jgi:cytochrome b6-f complex iron-sulfur subunit
MGTERVAVPMTGHTIRKTDIGGRMMDRKEFLSILGLGAAAVACSYCIGGCTVNDPGITAPTNVDFTWDITNSAYSGLNSVGTYLYNNGVIVAHTPSGFVAVSSACTHQGTNVYYESGTNTFFCPAHGSRFSTNGGVLNGPANKALAKYNTTLTGNLLRVFS